MSDARVRLVLAALLIVSGATFAVGSSIERPHTHESVQPSTETSPTPSEGGGTEGSGEGAGASSGETAPPATESHAETVGSETLFGINPESTGLVTVGVIVSLLLAAAVWYWGRRPVLLAAVVFGIAFAALDVREAVHQAHESRTGLLILAIALAVLHGAVVAVAASGLRGRRSAPVGA
jgi:hypothetical protein